MPLAVWIQHAISRGSRRRGRSTTRRGHQPALAGPEQVERRTLLSMPTVGMSTVRAAILSKQADFGGPEPSHTDPQRLIPLHFHVSSQPAIAVARNMVYRAQGGRTLALDVYRPATAVPAGGWPVILAIHGGGWRRFSKEEYEPRVAPLAREGYVVVVPNYSLSAPGRPSWPRNLDDVRQAVRWVRSHAASLGADPNRIAAMGESAGGHLAALLGTDAEGGLSPSGSPPLSSTAPQPSISARVQAVVDFYGPTDLTTLYQESPLAARVAVQLLGANPDSAPALYRDASPTTHVAPGDPPMLLIQGAADSLVPQTQATELDFALTAAGVPHRLMLVPGAGHGFGFRAAGRNLLPDVLSFLNKALGLGAHT